MQLPIPRLASALLTLTLARFPPQAPIRSASSALGTTTILALSATLGTTTPSQTISSKLWPTQLHGARPCSWVGHNFDDIVCEGVVVPKVADRAKIVGVPKAEDAERIGACGGNRAKVSVSSAEASRGIGSCIGSKIDIHADIRLNHRAAVSGLNREYCLSIGDHRGVCAASLHIRRCEPCKRANFLLIDCIVILYPIDNTEHGAVCDKSAVDITGVKQLNHITLAKRIGIR